MRKKVVFAIVAHPDDIELAMAGTLLLLKDEGWKIHYMTIANGCLGSNTQTKDSITKIRRQESLNAAHLLGATYHESLVDDFEILYTPPTLRKLTSILRQVQPDILLTHSPLDYMEDHMNACRLAIAAAFCKGMKNYPCDPPAAEIDRDIVVYHSQPHMNRNPVTREMIVPEIWVDISLKLQEKIELLGCHKSQREWLRDSQGMDEYLETMKGMNRELGELLKRNVKEKLNGFEYVEGWRRRYHIGYSQKESDPLSEVLGKYSVMLTPGGEVVRSSEKKRAAL